MTYHVRLMRRDDVTQVAEIDHEAFPSAWPAANFTHELENLLAHYLVVESDNDMDAVVPSKATDSVSGVRRLFNYRLFGRKVSPPASRCLVGFVGFWIMADEAHITSIAVRTSHRCRGIGELLLISAIELAAELNARMVTLEVRVSNLSAQSLYHKFGFAQVG
ncbi:MAG: GNAT family N-acetyltransferase, partial [Dehalococcoidales bacterium]|nr:GNAT family N-acetyltransferase [Dehalococcoidales bacterium]